MIQGLLKVTPQQGLFKPWGAVVEQQLRQALT